MPRPGDRLFRNRGDGTFEDVTDSAGLAGMARGYGQGVAVGDYDNDGHPDLFVTRWRSYLLLPQPGRRHLRGCDAPGGPGRATATGRPRPPSPTWTTTATSTCMSATTSSGTRTIPSSAATPSARCPSVATRASFEALPDHLFRNDGGRFIDVTAEAGIVDRDGRGLGVVAVDVDDDGRVDLFVANDLSANYLLRNRGGFRFEEQGLGSGVACNALGGYQAGMGVAAGDLDGDGRPDLAVTNFFNESTTLFHNLGDGQFADHTTAVGLAAPSRYRLGFGIAFLDADNDGRLDLMTANGHVNDYRPEVPYAMPVQLLLGGPGGRLDDVTARAGPALLVPHIGRGLAIGDLDNDGRIDAVLVAQNEPLVYLHNRTAGGHCADDRAGGDVLEPGRRGRPGDRRGRRLATGGATSRRRQLPVGERLAAPLRPGPGDADRPARGPLAFGPGGSVSGPRGEQGVLPPGREFGARRAARLGAATGLEPAMTLSVNPGPSSPIADA